MSDSDQKVDTFLDNAIKKLLFLKVDLVRGDLICFEGIHCYRNTGICIFDGKKLLNLSFEYDEYGHLPKKFHVINNNVPIQYWSWAHRGIDHNSIIWFDQTQVKQQCLDNIVFGKSSAHTTFVINDKSYIMEYMLCDNDFDEIKNVVEESQRPTFLMNKLKKKLNDNNILLLDYFDGMSAEQVDHKPAGNVVYISSFYDQENNEYIGCYESYGK